MYYINLLKFIAAILSIFILYWIIDSFYKQWKRKTITSMPFSKEAQKILNKIPYYQKLSQQDKEKLQKSILLFINEKEFIGKGIEITLEIKVTIAFYACLLLLKIDTNNCYDNLTTIIVYPHTMVIENLRNSGGIYSKEEILIDGQSANDTLLVAWDSAKKEAFSLSKDNVLIHEFAHEIDFLDGQIDGIPPLSKAKYQNWAKILYEDFNKLKNKALTNRYWGKYKLLGSYAATNEAEFFAVATERFFTKPHSLKKHFPKLYNILKDFYKIDPDALI